MPIPLTPEGELWILSANGTPYWPDNPQPENISLRVIAQSLAQKVRFGGHGRPFYSVAQHAVFVANIVIELGGGKRAALHGLMHDAHEAWLVDLPSPLKKQPAIHGWWTEMERRWDDVIFDTLEIPDNPFIRNQVKFADSVALVIEGPVLMPAPPADWEWLGGYGASDPDTMLAADIARNIEGSPAHSIWAWKEAEKQFLNWWDDLR